MNVKNLASQQRVEHLQKIQNAYSKCKEFSDDKVQLAMQTYEMVNRYTGILKVLLSQYVDYNTHTQCVDYFFYNVLQFENKTIYTVKLLPTCNLFSIGGQTYLQTGCRSGTVRERAKGETGSERL